MQNIQKVNMMAAPITFLNDDSKHDGSTWTLLVYFKGYGIVKHNYKPRFLRFVNFKKLYGIWWPPVKKKQTE